MKRKPTSYSFNYFLRRVGFRWHSTGTLSSNGVKFGEYLEGDFLTDEVRGKLIEKFGDWVTIKWAGSQYAPERPKRPLVVLLSQKAHDALG